VNFKDTKYSGGGNNYISENTCYELQEVQEKTIYEEENDVVQNSWEAKKIKAKLHRMERNSSLESGPNEQGSRSKQLSKKQQTLVKQGQIYGTGSNFNSKKPT